MAESFNGFGFNKLHVACMEKGAPLPDYRDVSITKKSDAFQLAPIHVAAINPCTKYLLEF